MRRRQARLVGIAAAIWIFAAPAASSAQTPDSLDRGGFAGPVSTSARVVGTNPSAMGMIDGISADFSHTLRLRSQTIETDADRADTFLLQSDPSIAFASDLGTERFRVGFIGALPRRYGSAWPSDGPQRFDSIFHRIRDIHLTAAGAFSPLEWLHVGGSIRFVQAEFRSYSAADMGPIVARQEGVDPASVPAGEPGNEGREFLDFNGRTLGWTAGVTLTPGKFRIGAAYHGPVPLELEGSYELYVPNNEYYRDRYGGDINRDATLETRWPGRLEAGFGYNYGPETEVFAGATWTRWSTVDEIAIDVADSENAHNFDRRESLDLRDTVEIRLGGTTRLVSWLAIDATLGGGSSSIPADALTARVVDMPKAFASVGARWQLTDGIAFRTGYQHVHYFGRTTDPGPDQPGTAGTYRQTLGLVETSLSIDLP